MKAIKLTNGGVTIVDDDIYEWASKTKWCWSAGKVQNTKSGKYLHRLILKTPKGMDTDHRNHFKWDNGRENLRVCTRLQNSRNQKVRTTFNGKSKLSKYKGVYRNGRRWQASIMLEGRHLSLGTFDIQEEAALAYNQAATLHFGEFACLNKIDREEDHAT